MRARAFILCSVVLWSLGGSLAKAGQGVGSGGDYLQFVFEQARKNAASILPRLTQDSFQSGTCSEILSCDEVRFILKNKQVIADDIAASAHVWGDQLPLGMCPDHTCACTVTERKSTVYFAFSTCRPFIDTVEKAARLLVHETMHHLGIVEENMATRMALGVYTAWEKLGSIDSPHWNRISRNIAPVGRFKSVVWTGREAIVWGGYLGGSGPDHGAVHDGEYGGRFSPLTDTWLPLAKANQPSERYEHVAVWARDAMIIWGGRAKPEQAVAEIYQDGAMYYPGSDNWITVSVKNAPEARVKPSAIVAGDEVLIWGGQTFRHGGRDLVPLASGGRYQILTGEWKSIATAGAPSPRHGHSAVWTGTEMIVWGGVDQRGEPLANGAVYTPSTDTWQAMELNGAPIAAPSQVAVWIPDHMVVFARNLPGVRGGAIYRRSENRWLPMNTDRAPMGQPGQTALWTGLQMVVYDGSDTGEGDNTSLYDPFHDSWSTPRSYSPSGLIAPGIVWTGLEAIVVGAGRRDTTIGGMFYP